MIVVMEAAIEFGMKLLDLYIFDAFQK